MRMRLLLTACLMALTYGSANADTINVLWYTAGVYSSTQQSELGTQLPAQSLVASSSSPGTPDNVLNITFWDGTGSVPSGSFNTLVVASPQGGWPNSSKGYGALENAFTSGALALGNRLMVTGQDADWHYLNVPGSTKFDNPQGFLIDSIDWSGSGKGMGAIFLGGADVGDSGTGLEKFLPGGSAALGAASGHSANDITIPAAFASFPINSGLTSAGLSNWNTSWHDSWNSSSSSIWTTINTNNAGTDFVTLVTNGGAGGLTPTAPEPASATLAGMGLVALLIYARRGRQRAEAV